MTLKTMPSEFQKALPIIRKIKEAGFEAYFVGGGVRDVLLERPIHDVDIATSSYPEETKMIFHRTVDIGIEHGTVLVLENGEEYEVTTFRTEDVYVDYRRPSRVSFVRSLEEDLKRRDFTVNALALAEDGQLIDMFTGLQDLQAKQLRAVGKAEERFEEDALRIMRGFRFASTLDFDIEAHTFKAMCTHAPLLKKISVERIFIEFDKLMAASHWRKGFALMLEAKAHEYLPGLKGKLDQLEALLESVESNYQFSTNELAWANLIISIHPTSEKKFLKEWKTSNEFQKKVQSLVSLYQIRLERAYSKKEIYQFGSQNAYLVEELRQSNHLEADFESVKEIDDQLAIHDKHEIKINGSDLIEDFNLKPGPDLGRILKSIEDEIVEGRLLNQIDDIHQFVQETFMNE